MDYIEMGKKYVMNTYNRFPVTFVKGEGAYLYDESGKKYLDFVAGIAVNNLGHCHGAVVEAVKEQSQNMMHISNLYWNVPQIELAKLIVENSFADKAFFCNSGTEANEAAIKLARKYSKIKHGAGRYEIITMAQSFHGRTMGSLAATGQTKYQQGFEPIIEGFRYAPFNDFDSLKNTVTEKTCAVMMEPLQGEGGIYESTPEFIRNVRKLCDERGLLLIFDEVQCGMGRTGKLFAYENYGVAPDIMTLAKALGGGLPLGAMVATEAASAGFKPGDHASTFGGNPVSCAAGIAVIKALKSGVLDNVGKIGAHIKERLEIWLHQYSFVNDIRGRGLMLGIELDKSVPVSDVVGKALQKGLLLLSAGHNVIRLVPPLTITADEADAALDIIEGIFNEI